MHHRQLLRILPAVGLGLVAGAPLLWTSSCQDTSYVPPDGGGGQGGNAATTYAPEGCSFEVAPRVEFTDWAVGRTETGATPGIVRVRVGLGGNVTPGATGRTDPATTIGFAWETSDDATLVSEVQWGTTPDPTGWAAGDRRSGISWLTPEGDLNGMGPARMHEVYACGLSPDTTYYYRVGGGPAGQEVWSEVDSFRTAPASGADTTVTIGVSGDSRGQQNDAWRLIQTRMRTLQPTFQMFSGDMINLAPDQGEWEAWLGGAERDTAGDLLTLGSQLVLAAHGNHDNHTSLFYGNLVLPQEPANFPAYGELFFSMDVGPVHVIVVDDAFLAFPGGDPNYGPALDAWLRADLDAADANRASVPWILAMHHHPEYSSSLHANDADVQRVKDFLAPIWHEYAVDLVMAGHDHNYERSKVLSGAPDTPIITEPGMGTGTMYLVCAGAGADSYTAGMSSFTDVSRDYKTGSALGFYAVLTATKTDLVIEGHELTADGTDPIFDSLTLTK